MSTPRRSLRAPPRTHTPRMSDRKKSLFVSDCGVRDGGGRRALPALHSESDSEFEERSLGVAALDSSSSGDEPENSTPGTPTHTWRETRSRTRRLLKDSQDMKAFIKSPYTLRNYQLRIQNDQKNLKSISTPGTPHVHHPGTPSSSHSTASAVTVHSEQSRARKSLASLIADTESCSSSLKDLNFDTDSGTDTKENTPKKDLRKSTRRKTMTPKLATFKGILKEQKKNTTSPSMDYSDTAVQKSTMLSPTQMLKTPHNTSDVTMSPPKISHSRRPPVEINESPDENDRAHKRLWKSLDSETGPTPKMAKLDTSNGAPKARHSLFNSDKLKEILSTKSFYPKSNIRHGETSPKVATTINKVETNTNYMHHKSTLGHVGLHRRKHRKPGEINLGVRHRIRKPKMSKYCQIVKLNMKKPEGLKPLSANNSSDFNTNASSMSVGQNDISDSLLYEREKGDPFDKEHQTIEALLSQWTEEEVPSSEPKLNQPLEAAHAKIRSAESLLSFNRSNVDDGVLFNPNAPVLVESCDVSHNADIIEIGSKEQMKMDSTEKCNFVELGSAKVREQIFSSSGVYALTKAQVHHDNEGPVPGCKSNQAVELQNDVVMEDEESTHKMVNGQPPKGGQFLPVEGGYLLVAENGLEGCSPEEVTDLDAIEREIATLDEQLSRLAESNNINPLAILSPGDVPANRSVIPEGEQQRTTLESVEAGNTKMFPIFSKTTAAAVPNAPTTTRGQTKAAQKKMILKSGQDQYVIDAGQKKFGATQCKECGVIYQIGDPQDEHDHLVHHNAVDVLRFNGWKEEAVVGVWGESRCVCVRGGDPRWRRVAALLERVVHPQLGYAGSLPRSDRLYIYTAYLYINKKQIVGCLIAEPKERAYKLVPGDVDCCSEEEYPVKCGVSRLWTHVSWRRRGVASSLLNCARASFLYGHVLAADELAFSAPTPAGRTLAAAYTRRADFYVYLD